jgi:hypothetical protein
MCSLKIRLIGYLGLSRRSFFAASVLGMNTGLDGFSTAFFHSAWPIISDNVCEAVLEFFHHGKLLKEANSTIITLVLKRKNPSSMRDYRPISYFNIIYKCITKILANRMIPRLEEVISSNQGAFIPCRGNS